MSRGTAGEAVYDLQAQLRRCGIGVDHVEPGVYCEGTDDAVRRFQEARGLRVDGVCGPQTWNALQEASYTLGDRVLYARTPMLRGDDVVDLQRRLGRLGFDAGRVDGIYGPNTVRALADFQRNVGIEPDGICGFETRRALDRVASRRRDASAVATVREEDELRSAPRTVVGYPVFIAFAPELAAVATTVARSLEEAGAAVFTTDDGDGSRQASKANEVDARLFLGLAPGAGDAVTYYAVPGFFSPGGRQLATRLAGALTASCGAPVAATGMRVPVLRETRMAAVVCEFDTTAWSAHDHRSHGRIVAATVSAWITRLPAD